MKETEKTPEQLEAEKLAEDKRIDDLADKKYQAKMKETEKTPEQLEAEEEDRNNKLIEAENSGIEKGKKLLQEELAIERKEKEKLKKQNQDLKADVEKHTSNTKSVSGELKGNLQHNLVSKFLRSLFKEDIFKDFRVGESGSDILQTVMKNGKECGNILWESKRLEPNQSFKQKEFIPKLLDEKKDFEASVAVFVTNKFPVGKDNMSGIEITPNKVCAIEKYGYYYCPMDEERVSLLANRLRSDVIAFSGDLMDDDSTEKNKVYNLLVGPRSKAIADIVNRKADERQKQRDKVEAQADLIIKGAKAMVSAHKEASRLDREIIEEQVGLYNEVRAITGQPPIQLKFDNGLKSKNHEEDNNYVNN